MRLAGSLVVAALAALTLFNTWQIWQLQARVPEPRTAATRAGSGRPPANPSPGVHLDRARDALERNDYRRAAAEIDAALGQIDAAMGQARDTSAAQLKAIAARAAALRERADSLLHPPAKESPRTRNTR